MKTYKQKYKELVEKMWCIEIDINNRLTALEQDIEEAEHTGWLEKSRVEELNRRFKALRDAVRNVNEFIKS